MPMTNQISRDELRSAIADKLCAHFGVTAETATDEQVFQAAAIVIREILSRLHTFDSRTAPEREVHYLSMEFLMGRSLMKDAFNLGIGDALTGALEDLGRSAADIFETEPDAGLGNGGLGRLARVLHGQPRHRGHPRHGLLAVLRAGHLPAAHRRRPSDRGRGQLAHGCIELARAVP